MVLSDHGGSRMTEEPFAASKFEMKMRPVVDGMTWRVVLQRARRCRRCTWTL